MQEVIWFVTSFERNGYYEANKRHENSPILSVNSLYLVSRTIMKSI